MIAYEDLVVALTNWRINQGLPTSAVTFLSQDTGSVDLALPVADPLEAAHAAVEEYAADEYGAEEISADAYGAEEISADAYVEEVAAAEYSEAAPYAAPAEEVGYEQADAYATSESTQEVSLEDVEEQADLAGEAYYETAGASEEYAAEVAAPQTEEIDALDALNDEGDYQASEEVPAEYAEQALDPAANFADLEDESTVMNQGLDEMNAPVSHETDAEEPEEL
jgi:hypothetical protein